jgi:Lon protease-like protein
MTEAIDIPKQVPIMTLRSAVLFPQAIMPLFIFEPRYRQMLRDVLAKDRIFAVAALNERGEATERAETPDNRRLSSSR